MVATMLSSTISIATEPFFITSHIAHRLSALRFLPSGSLHSSIRFKRRAMVLGPAKCFSEQQQEQEQPSSPPSVSSSSSTFAWCAGLGALGFLETGYLTYLKFTNSDAFCPVGGGGCSDVLNSDYAIVADEWWMNFGIDDPSLQNLAIRILSQTCSSSGCERNWSVFERIHTKRRNRLEHKRLNDLVYTHYNLRLKERQSSGKMDSLTDPISLENIDLTDEWVVEAEDDDVSLLDVSEIDDWMDVVDAIIDVGEGGAATGVPLPLIGMVAYGLVASLGFHLARKQLLPEEGATDGRLVLLSITTSMAAASGYFVYLLSTKLAGTSCSYCMISVILSFSLFFITLKEFGLGEVQKVGGLQLALAGVVIAALTASYNVSRPELTSMDDIDLQPFEPEITTESSPLSISLANYLHSIGAKMYGAFWCSHCLEQKQMFGREAAKIVDYVECFPDGYRKGVKIAKACADAGIEGFPTWVIRGQVLSGEKEFEELAQASGFILDDFHPE